MSGMAHIDFSRWAAYVNEGDAPWLKQLQDF